MLRREKQKFKLLAFEKLWSKQVSIVFINKIDPNRCVTHPSLRGGYFQKISNQKISYVRIQKHPPIRAGSVSPEQSQPASKSNMTKYPRFHDFHSNRQFSLIIPIINSQHLYGKPPTLLRDLGSKNHQFWSESMFLKKETDYLIWSHRSWYIKHFSLKSAIFGEKNFKKFWDEPFLKICKKWPTWAFVVSGVFRTIA